MAGLHNKEADWQHWKDWEVKVVDGVATRFRDVKVYEFRMSDVDDIEIYSAAPIHEWSQTEAGKWVFENAVETPYWMRRADYINYGHHFVIMARMSEQNETFFKLKYVHTKN